MGGAAHAADGEAMGETPRRRRDPRGILDNGHARHDARDIAPADWAGAHDLDNRCIGRRKQLRSEEHTSELQSLMRISYAVFCLKKKKQNINSSMKYI